MSAVVAADNRASATANGPAGMLMENRGSACADAGAQTTTGRTKETALNARGVKSP